MRPKIYFTTLLFFGMVPAIFAQEKQVSYFHQDSGYFLRLGVGSWQNGTANNAARLRQTRLVNNAIHIASARQPLVFSNVFIDYPTSDGIRHMPSFDMNLGYDFSFGLSVTLRRLQSGEGDMSIPGQNAFAVARISELSTQEASRTQLIIDQTFFPFRGGENQPSMGIWGSVLSGLGFKLGVMAEAEIFTSRMTNLSRSTSLSQVDSQYLDQLNHYLFGLQYEWFPKDGIRIHAGATYQTSFSNRGVMKDEITSLGPGNDPILSLLAPDLPVSTQTVAYEILDSRKTGMRFELGVSYALDEKSRVRLGYVTERVQYNIREAKSGSEISPLLALAGGGNLTAPENLVLLWNNLGPMPKSRDITRLFYLEASLGF